MNLTFPARRSGLFASLGRSLTRVGGLGGPGNPRRRRELIELIRSSTLFDERWYLATYPDVAAAGVDPARHFLETGWREGRDPSPDFAVSSYLKANSDVARAGINPLIHFLQFGQSEGREVRAHNPAIKRLPVGYHQFGDPAPVFRGEIPQPAVVGWLQSHRLDTTEEALVQAGELAIGYAGRAARDAIESAFATLRALSGFDDGEELGRETWAGAAPAELADAWFVNEAQLRVRWHPAGEPLVVRAYQHEPLDSGALRLVGETLVESPLRFLDVSGSDGMFPILFVFSTGAGELVGSCLLPFPSLCRGGLHYPELLAAADADKDVPHPLRTGLKFARLLTAARADRRRRIGRICVDLAGADGTSPLFRRGFRRWLERVARVGTVARTSDESAAAALLEAAGEADGEPAGGDACTLVLAADMIPTIGALCGSDAQQGPDAGLLPLLVAEPDPSQPALLVEPPPAMPETASAPAEGYAALWPRCDGAGDRPFPAPVEGPAAIRLLDGRPLTEAELLVPVSAPVVRQSDVTPSLTWLLIVEAGQATEAVEALTALSMQAGLSAAPVALVGQLDDGLRAAAARLFGGRISAYDTAAAAVADIDSDYVAYIGPGVVLHEPYCGQILLSLVEDGDVASAACPLLTTDKRGKSWHVALTDGGKVAEVGSNRSLPLGGAEAQRLWRSTFAVAAPPRDLWLARTATAKAWVASKGEAPLSEGFHLCTTLVTASYSTTWRKRRSAIAVPRAPDERTLRLRTLFG